MTDKHTPKPWTAESVVGGVTEDGSLAKLIARRLNSHAALVEIVRLFVDADSLEDSEMYQTAMTKARAALSEMTQ